MDWNAFSAFLAAGAGRGLFVKAVVTADTTEEDVSALVSRIEQQNAPVPLYFQPVSPGFGQDPPEASQLEAWVLMALRTLQDVRVLPQVHRLAGWK